jgi:purine-nucleoside phosphorylase
MSTSHEAIVASYCGLKVLAFSIVTDRVVVEFDAHETVDHHDVVKVANQRAREAEELVARFLTKISQNKHLIH